MKARKVLVGFALVVALGLAAVFLVDRFSAPETPATALTLYGNVELRQVSLAFNQSERVAEVLVEEGDRVRRGQVLARLETDRLIPQVAQARAQVAAQKQVVARLRHGSRPEEIAQARANLEAARVTAADARLRYERLDSLRGTSGVSAQDLQTAQAAADAAAARATVAEKNLDLLVAGPRQEDIAEAEARLDGAQAQLAALEQQLADAELVAPMDAIVRTRILEPGEMASPQTPAFSLAITEPKWIRTYIAEPDLGRVRPGMEAQVTSDSAPDRPLEGRVSFISAVAEFTPKTLQSEELRTSLVYEMRVLVADPADRLRLGMPVTVRIPLPVSENENENAGAVTTPKTRG